MRRILCLHMPHLAAERVRRVARPAADRGWAKEKPAAGYVPPDGEPLAERTGWAVGPGAGRVVPVAGFAAECLESRDQRVTERAPPVVLTRTVGAAQEVAQVGPHAAARGLRPGMSLGQAQALVPELIIRPYEPARDRAALRKLADWAVRFSPVVEPADPDTLLLDVTGCELLFGGEASLAHQAAEGLARAGFSARAAIADTIGAAYAVASAGSDSVCVVPPGQTSAWLAPLPPSALRIDPRVCDRLDALGVRTVGDLLMLPRSTLPARFGQTLVLRIEQALGEVFEPLTPHVAEPISTARQRFEMPVTDVAVVQTLAVELLDAVFGEVLDRQRALHRLECVLHLDRVGPRVLRIGLARASREPRHVAQLLQQRLERIDLTPGVLGLTVLARETSVHLPDQVNLFEPRPPQDAEALGDLVDRLANRLGYEAVARPQPIDDHQPEKAYRYVSVAAAGLEPGPTPGAASRSRAGIPPVTNRCHRGSGTASTSSRPAHHPPAPAPLPPRPVRLLPRPVLVRAIALVPDGPPTWFAWNGAEHVITQATGPERIETAWWRGRDVRRDYYRVTTQEGVQYWLFRARDDGRWYVHGVFA